MTTIDALNEDPDIRAMKRSRRAPILFLVGFVLGLPLLAGGYTVWGKLATAIDLAQQGFTDVKVEIDGPFAYRFTARKGHARCSGSITRTPFSTSSGESCYGP